jgi:hypothetical protein
MNQQKIYSKDEQRNYQKSVCIIGCKLAAASSAISGEITASMHFV